MQADGIIGKYAIGGAVGATFYLEPASSLDVDIFVALPTSPGGAILNLAPIYDYLRTCGGKVDGEYIVVGGWPVQFLPPRDAFDPEALGDAGATGVESVRTWVMTAEHLVAIALRTGRAKDYNRVLQFVEQQSVDRSKLQNILQLHGLISKWQQFERKYLRGVHE